MTRHRGLKRFSFIFMSVLFYYQQTHDPTQGIKTSSFSQLPARIWHQQTHDPTQGIKTDNKISFISFWGINKPMTRHRGLKLTLS